VLSKQKPCPRKLQVPGDGIGNRCITFGQADLSQAEKIALETISNPFNIVPQNLQPLGLDALHARLGRFGNPKKTDDPQTGDDITSIPRHSRAGSEPAEQQPRSRRFPGRR
jgi:hypothetical protein